MIGTEPFSLTPRFLILQKKKKVALANELEEV